METLSEKKRIPLIPNEKNPETHLELSIDFQSDNANWYNGRLEHKGYFMYCIPVTQKNFRDNDGRETPLWSQTLGKGKKIQLLEVSRRSKKAGENALTLSKTVEPELIRATCAAYGLTLASSLL